MVFRRTSQRWVVSPVLTRPQVSTSDLVHTTRYRFPIKYRLSQRYDEVNDRNRFKSMEILLKRLSGYVGRRQYKMQHDFAPLLDQLKAEEVDWHDLKALPPEARNKLFAKCGVTPSQRVVLMTAIGQRCCGVIQETEGSGAGLSVCMRHGKEAFGWRCGKNGHTEDIYFEHKEEAKHSVVASRRSRIVQHIEQGVVVQVRQEPSFALDGRRAEVPHYRAWNTAEKETRFDVEVIGYEFLIHPSDPRCRPQIADVAHEWSVHAEAIRNVFVELMEMSGVEQEPQPLELKPGDMAPEEPVDPFKGFGVRSKQSIGSSAAATAPAVEYKMKRADGRVVPWFTPPDPQEFNEGVPAHLPFAPSIVVRSEISFSPNPDELFASAQDRAKAEQLSAEEYQTHLEQDREHLLRHPHIDLSCFIHPACCVGWTREEEDRMVGYVLEMARKMPYALPFNLYLRVDPVKLCRTEEFVAAKKERMEKKAQFFDLKHRFGGPTQAIDHVPAQKFDDTYESSGVGSEDVLSQPPTSPTQGRDAADEGDTVKAGSPYADAAEHQRAADQFNPSDWD